MSDVAVSGVTSLTPGIQAPDDVVWIDPAGAQTILTAQPQIKSLRGRSGFHMPPVRWLDEIVPEQHGTNLRQVTFGPREAFVPILILGTTASGLRTQIRTLLPTLDPTAGEGKLRVTAPDSSIREMNCRYIGGLELEEQFPDAGWVRAGLVFRAFDPFWYDQSDQSSSYSITAGSNAFFPFFPLDLNNSTIYSSPSINNTGDVEAWPVWTITGPGQDILLKNTTTAKTLDMRVTLRAGEVLTIDTRPGKKSVTLGGANLYSLLNLRSNSSLWSLAKGTNALEIRMGDVTSASSVALAYKRRYLGA